MRTAERLVSAFAIAVVGSLVSAAHAVDCSNATIVCNTFTKGSAKFKPALNPGGCGSAPNETISLKGTISDCVVTGASGVTVVSGSLKGTLYTGDCSCLGLAAPTALVTPPPNKQNALVVKWKFAPGAACNPGQNTSTLSFTAASVISPGVLVPPAFPAPGGIYGFFALAPPAATPAVSGIFTGGSGGANSTAVGTTTESAATLLGTCNTAPAGLKGFTFGQGQIALQ